MDEPDTTKNIVRDLIIDFRALAFDYGRRDRTIIIELDRCYI
jgi:hypothetical protein